MIDSEDGAISEIALFSLSLCSVLSLLISHFITSPFSSLSLLAFLLSSFDVSLNIICPLSQNPSMKLVKTTQHLSPLLLPDQSLVVKVPDDDVAVTAAGEADLVVRGDGQSVAGGSRRRQLCLDARGGRGQVPDGQRAGLPADDQGPSVWEDFTGADVVIPVLIRQDRKKTVS